MTPAPTPDSLIDAAAARLTETCRAQGALELHFIRQIAVHTITRESVQRTVNQLSISGDPKDDARLDRFPEQTKGTPPLADHAPHVGFYPPIIPLGRRRTDTGRHTEME